MILLNFSLYGWQITKSTRTCVFMPLQRSLVRLLVLRQLWQKELCGASIDKRTADGSILDHPHHLTTLNLVHQLCCYATIADDNHTPCSGKFLLEGGDALCVTDTNDIRVVIADEVRWATGADAQFTIRYSQTGSCLHELVEMVNLCRRFLDHRDVLALCLQGIGRSLLNIKFFQHMRYLQQ